MKALRLGPSIVAIAGFILIVLCLNLVGVVPIDALAALVRGSMGSAAAWSETIRQTAPLLLVGVAVFLSLKAGLFNIGAEGQFLMGGLCATVIALNVPSWLGTAAGLVCGAAAGAAWALPAGLIKAHRNGHEVISTIMLNAIAASIVVAMVSGPLRNPDGLGTATSVIDGSTWIPEMSGRLPLKLSASLPLLIIIVCALAIWFKKSVGGYEVLAAGQSKAAAEAAGVDTKRLVVVNFAWSGSIAGFAGALQLFAYEHDFFVGFSSGYGFDALGVAILAGGSPWGLVPSALFFGILAKGSTSIQVLGVPKGLSGVLLGILIIVVATYRFRRSRPVD